MLAFPKRGKQTLEKEEQKSRLAFHLTTAVKQIKGSDTAFVVVTHLV